MTISRFSKLIVLLVFAGLIHVSSADANNIAYEVGTPTDGSQAFGGSLGMDFDVLSTITVTDIGVFDSGQDGLNLPITAQLWTRDGDTGTLISGSETLFNGTEGTLMGGSRFKPLDTPLVLAPGSYTINAFGYGDTEMNGNTGGPADKSINDGGGLITFVGGGRFGDAAAAGDFPNVPDGGPENRYAAGTFIFVPEPTSCGLATIGLIGLMCLRRRFRRVR